MPTAAEVRAKDAEGLTALHHAARQGDTGRVRLLLDHGAAIEAGDRFERTPLHWAAIGGHKSTTRLLLERGAKPLSRAWFDLTPLHYAAMLGQAHIVELWCEAGAEVDAPDFYGRTALHLGADNATIKTLLSCDARLEAIDHQGRTPLHLVRNEGGAKALVDAGADAMTPARDGRRPLDMTIAASSEGPGLLLFPGAGTVRMRQEQATLAVEAHNVSAEALAAVKLVARSHAATIEVAPPVFPLLAPGQVLTFNLTVTRRPEVAAGQHALRLAVVVGESQRVTTELPLDSRRELTPEDQGMIKVGTVRVQPTPALWQYAAYGSAPLLLLGIWFLTRRRSRPGQQNDHVET